MSIGSIALSGIGYGALAVALSGFASDSSALVGAGLEQETLLGTGSISQTRLFTGEGLVQEIVLGDGYITQIGAISEPGMTSGIPATDGIKKPGIPGDTPAWLKTTLEIYSGRRGNAITIPSKQTLTFSASPTQAECEALDNKLNEVYDTMKKLITRFDS